MSTIPTPVDIAGRLPRNRAKLGDTVVYRDPTTLLVEHMIVEAVFNERNGCNKVYAGSGNRLINSRLVTEVRHA